jgi:hypothetical protein
MTVKTNLPAIHVVVLGGLLLPAVLSAQNSASPQGGAGIYAGNAVCVGANFNQTPSTTVPPPCLDNTNNGQWFTVMNSSLRTSNTTDLFISPSLVTGLYTDTQVKGNSTTSQTAAATGSVAVRVLIDCTNCAAVGAPQAALAVFTTAGQPDPLGTGIVFDARIQQLSATLGSVITTDCIAAVNTCTPEQIDLILSTTSAHSFNYILTNVGSGVHTITVQARLDVGQVCTNNNPNGTGGVTCSNAVNTTLGSSIAAALFGVGSVIVQPVHLAPGFSFSF